MLRFFDSEANYSNLRILDHDVTFLTLEFVTILFTMFCNAKLDVK